MSSSVDTIRDLAAQDYKWGFITEIDEDRVPKGLNEDIVRLISARKGEPEFMLEWRLNALRHWFQMEREQGEPKWANVKFPPIDYQNIVYYSAPKQKPSLDSLNTRRDLKATEWFAAQAEDPYWILDTVEYKTAWHPIGI